MLWASKPLQSFVDAHALGRKSGQQTGDFLYATLNWHVYVVMEYVVGHGIDTVLRDIREFIWQMQSRSSQAFLGNSILLHYHVLALKEGLHVLDGGSVCNIPTEGEFFASAGFGRDHILVLNSKIHQLVRAFLFRQLDVTALERLGVWDEIREKKHLLRPIYLMGIFFEGLASFQVARQANGQTDERARWIAKGGSILEQMTNWSSHSSWNWENKRLLLEAEKARTLGDFDSAASFYEIAVRSAHDHKFIHEEAIAR